MKIQCSYNQESSKHELLEFIKLQTLALEKASVVLKKQSEALEKIEDIAKENDNLLQGYHLEWANNKLILEAINEVLND